MSPLDDPDTKISHSGSYSSYDENLVNNHFIYGASQVNADLAVAAECEAQDDFGPQDNDWLDFYGSYEYMKLRNTFIADVKANLNGGIKKDALLNAVYRAYYAGMLSPERKEPESAYVRRERFRQRRESMKKTATE